LWIGVSMTMRRAVDAGASPGIALFFFLPGVNLVLMLLLCLPPTRHYPAGTAPPARLIAGKERMQSAMLGVAASLAITVISVVVAIYLRRRYSAGLFLGVPSTIGHISSYLYNYRVHRPAREPAGLALAHLHIDQ